MSAPLRAADGETYRAISFDVDGTLYQPGLRVYLRAFTTPGAARTLKLLKRAREPLRTAEFPDGESLRTVLAQRLAELGGMQPQEARTLLTRTRDVYWARLLKDMAPASTVTALRALAEKGITLAAFSDHDTRAKLTALGLEGLFSVVISAEDEGAYKPHRKGFIALLQQLKQPAAYVLHVGDRADTDGEGALQAGMGVVLLGPPPTDPRMGHVGGLDQLVQRVFG